MKKHYFLTALKCACILFLSMSFFACKPANDADKNAYNDKGYNETTMELVRMVEENPELNERIKTLPVKEFFTFTTERGDNLNAYIVKPVDFDPNKKYPVLLTQYSGPGSQSVADSFSMGWESVMVANGYIVVCCDGRGTGFMGEKFKKQTYGNLGALEVEDQISFARYMASQSYVDAERIGIYGWSYGGFMALGCALKGDGLFKMAIAVVGVLPVLIVYPFFQKYFVKGLTVGGVKG